MNIWTKRAIAIPVALAFFICIAVGAASLWAFDHYQHIRGTLEPRLERLSGLINAAPNIQANLDQAVQQLEPWLQPASTNAATDVQQRLRQLVDSAGLTTVALQSVEAAVESDLAHVRLSATVTGSWPSAVQFLQSLQQQRPALWVQAFSIQRDGRDMPNDPQTVRLTLQIDAPVAREATP